MDFKILLVVVIIGLISNEAAASCTCKLTGKDVCGCSGSIVRPAPIKKPIPAKPQKVCKMIGGVEPLAPIGDACSCDSQLVVPAIPAPVPCTKLRIDLDAPPCKVGCDYAPIPLGFHDYYSEPAPKPVPVPADPVSLILAYELAQKAAAAVPEEKLQFGFRKKPEDGMYKKILKNIPEERLFGVEREIVELKVPKLAAPVVEEFVEESVEADVVLPPAAFLSYSDLGYGPVKPSAPQFLVKKPGGLPPPPPAALDFDCGFVPGKVVIRDHLVFDKPKPCGCLGPDSVELYSSLEDSVEDVVPLCPCKKLNKIKKPCFF